MKKFFQKAVTRVMSLTLALVSVVAISAMPANAATGTTIYFKDTQNWGKAYYYSYTADTNSAIGNAWPGQAMTSVGGNWYKAVVPATKTFNVVFNDAVKPTAKQTGDVKDLTAGGTFYLVPGGSSSKNANGIGGGVPVTKTTTAPSDFPASNSKADSKAATTAKDATPQTGDSNNAAMIGAIGILALAAACLSFKKKKAEA